MNNNKNINLYQLYLFQGSRDPSLSFSFYSDDFKNEVEKKLITTLDKCLSNEKLEKKESDFLDKVVQKCVKSTRSKKRPEDIGFEENPRLDYILHGNENEFENVYYIEIDGEQKYDFDYIEFKTVKTSKQLKEWIKDTKKEMDDKGLCM